LEGYSITMAEELILKASKILAEKKLTIAFAESATAGWLCSEFALAPESGKTLMGGIVCYDADIKKYLLKIPEDFIEKYTPESAEVTEELAKRLQTFIHADIQVAVTGLTTPGGSETIEKPVGTMFIHIIVKGRSLPVRKVCKGSAEDIIHETVRCVAQKLIDELS
jgi:nicotinamide-nucleotide amidase